MFSSHSFWTSSSLDVPAGVTQEEGHTGFLIHLPSAERALIFLARRIQPFLSLVNSVKSILCTNDLIVLHPLGIFILSFSFLVRKYLLPGSNSRPNVSEGYEVPLSYRGDRYFLFFCFFVFSSHSFWTSSSFDVPAGVTQEEGHTGFLIHLLSAMRALIFSREGFSHSFPSSTVKSNFVN